MKQIITETYVEYYGYNTFEKHPLAKVINEELFIGNIKIEDYNAKLFQNTIPSLYCLREIDTKCFICGVDLLENGMIWCGSNGLAYNYIEEFIESIPNNTYLCIEGSIQL